MSVTRTSLRRYPALGFLAVAALLASLLPSALRVPLSGPSTSAELAPVPGKSDSAQGDLSALGQTSTGGLGSGGGLGGLGTGGRDGGGSRRPNDDGSGGGPPDGGGGRNPTQKRCVGKPPRQTEDPLSPPCVAYFKGDNGGATAKGVTADEIVVVHDIQEGCGVNGPEFVDYDDTDDPRRDPVYAAYVRYFNDRFQTYGRRVHLYGARNACGGGTTDAAQLQEVEERYRPFFLIWSLNETSEQQVARTGTFVVASHHAPKRSNTLRHPPFLLSYRPDLDNQIESAAEFLCARLAGRPARFALDPSLRSQRRKFGLFYSQLGDLEGEGEAWFLDRVRDRCGDAAGEVVRGGRGNDPTTTFARMRAAGVTTVVVFTLNPYIPSYAETGAGGWHPEWFLPDDLDVGDNLGTRMHWGAQAGSAFGIVSNRRLGHPAQQPHRQAWAEGCGCPDAPPLSPLWQYERFFLLFSGIQAAGPRLTPANFDKGLHALPARQSLDPFTPAAYFAPGNYSFVKDWAVTWWDPAGRPPGSNNAGCWRLVEDGLRYRAEDWQKRPGDEGIQQRDPEQPCQADL